MVENPNYRRGRPKIGLDPNPDGSGQLAAPRRELFSCYASRLSNLTDAYISAGYTCASRGVASRNGSRLRAREFGVKERIVFLAELSDDAFEVVFENARARIAALEQAELGNSSEALLTAHNKSQGDSGIEPDAPEKGAPDSRAELVGTREVLEYVVRMSRMLNERAKQLDLGANIRKRVLTRGRYLPDLQTPRGASLDCWLRSVGSFRARWCNLRRSRCWPVTRGDHASWWMEKPENARPLWRKIECPEISCRETCRASGSLITLYLSISGEFTEGRANLQKDELSNGRPSSLQQLQRIAFRWRSVAVGCGGL